MACRNQLRSNSFLSFLELKVFHLRIARIFCDLFFRIVLDSEFWSWLVPFEWLRSGLFIKVDWQQNTKTQYLQKTENQNKPKSNPYSCYCCRLPPVRSSQKKIFPDLSNSIKKYHIADKNALVGIHCQQKKCILLNIVFQVDKYVGIYWLCIRIQAGGHC